METDPEPPGRPASQKACFAISLTTCALMIFAVYLSNSLGIIILMVGAASFVVLFLFCVVPCLILEHKEDEHKEDSVFGQPFHPRLRSSNHSLPTILRAQLRSSRSPNPRRSVFSTLDLPSRRTAGLSQADTFTPSTFTSVIQQPPGDTAHTMNSTTYVTIPSSGPRTWAFSANSSVSVDGSGARCLPHLRTMSEDDCPPLYETLDFPSGYKPAENSQFEDPPPYPGLSVIEKEMSPTPSSVSHFENQ